MIGRDTGALPVMKNAQPSGVVTDRDISIRAVAEGKDPRSSKVGDIMTPEVVYCYADEEIDVAIDKMKKHQLRRLLIKNRDEKLAGIVSLGDLALAMKDERLTGDVLREVSK